MRIALIIGTLDGGGAEAVVRTLATEFARADHAVFVYCLREGGKRADSLRASGVTVREARSDGFDPGLPFTLRRWMRRDAIEVVSAHSSAALVMAAFGAKTLGLPLQQTRHGALLGRPSRHYRLADALAPFVDCVGVVAESLRRTLPRGRACERAVTLHNGVDCAPTPRDQAHARLEALCGRPLRGPLVLAVGAVCEEKDPVSLIRAFDAVRKRLPDAQLVWIGPTRDAATFAAAKAAERELGLDNAVHWPGGIPDAWRLMSAADVFCLPSKTEAMPMSVAEAMSQRAPVVATAVGGVGRLDDEKDDACLLRHADTGLLVPPANPDALATALIETLSDRTTAKQRAARAYEDFQKRFSSERMAADYLALFRRLIARRQRQRGDQPATPGVLMAGAGAGYVGGIASVIDSLMTCSLNKRVRLHRFSPPPVNLLPSAPKGVDMLQRPWRALRAALRHLGLLIDFGAAVKRQRIDVAHIHTCSRFSFYRSLLDVAVAKLSGCRAVIHIHGAEFHEFCARNSWLGRHLVRWGAETADAVVVLSEYWAETLRPFLGRARIVAVPNGVAPPPNAPAAGVRDAQRCRFLLLGNLSPRKGVRELIEASALLRQRGVNFEVLLAGPTTPTEHEQWRRAIAAHKLDDVVTMIGPTFGAAKWRLLADCDCFVLPSHNEGLPIVLLEAGVMGLPFIATTVGSIPEFMSVPAQTPAGETRGFLAPLVPPKDVASLANEMQRLAVDGELRRQIGARVRAHIEANYTMDCVAARTARLYEELLGRRLPERDASAGNAKRATTPAASSGALC